MKIKRNRPFFVVGGNRVSIVYISSDHLDEVGVISSQHMANTYPRTFRYSVLPHYDMGAEGRDGICKFVVSFFLLRKY